MGGQACVLYGAAEFSRDADFAVLASHENLERLRGAMDDLQAEVIAVPLFERQYLERGHAVHFRCTHPDVANFRVHVMARLRGVDPFDALWSRRTTWDSARDSRWTPSFCPTWWPPRRHNGTRIGRWFAVWSRSVTTLDSRILRQKGSSSGFENSALRHSSSIARGGFPTTRTGCPASGRPVRPLCREMLRRSGGTLRRRRPARARPRLLESAPDGVGGATSWPASFEVGSMGTTGPSVPAYAAASFGPARPLGYQ